MAKYKVDKFYDIVHSPVAPDRLKKNISDNFFDHLDAPMPEASARTFLEDEVINFLSGLKHLGLTVWPLLTKEFCLIWGL